MGEFVEIKSSVSDIMRVANGLSGTGRRIKGEVERINADISAHEGHPDVFPADQFTDSFTPIYQGAATDSAGKPSTVNEAVRTSAVDAGQKLIDIGEYVGKAMVQYGVADDEAAADIEKTPRP